MKAKIISVAMVIAFWLGSIACAQDPLPSWNNTGPKKAIVDFVERITKENSSEKERVDRDQHEGRLENNFPANKP
jgi:hypothetical protein